MSMEYFKNVLEEQTNMSCAREEYNYSVGMNFLNDDLDFLNDDLDFMEEGWGIDDPLA